MAWQKKGTKHTYDSNSGHAYFIGVCCGKVVQMLVYSKTCTKCDIDLVMSEAPMDHDDCPCNYKNGSSKVMEASAALDMILELHTLGVRVKCIFSNNDITICNHLHHIGTAKAKLPIDVPNPEFL